MITKHAMAFEALTWLAEQAEVAEVHLGQLTTGLWVASLETLNGGAECGLLETLPTREPHEAPAALKEIFREWRRERDV